MSKRIQLRRTKGWRLPVGAVIVSRPSRWGNPFSVGSGIPQDCCEYACYEDEGCTCDGCMSPAKAVALYLGAIADQCARDPGHADRWTAPLRGHDLACWCSLDQPCHADVLLELANR